MAEYLSKTISDLVNKIMNQEIILPAMQRNFVWPENKIYHLFDSLMRDYPIGTFLFWDISDEIRKQYAFNQFIINVDDKKGEDQRGNTVNKELSKYIAVLDGQQRITSLLVGVMGKWITRIKGKKRSLNTSYVDRYLCIDLLTCPQNPDDEYLFRFVPDSEIETISEDKNGNKHFWLKVSKVFSIERKDGKNIEFDEADYMDDLCDKYQSDFNNARKKDRRKMLQTLRLALHEKDNINYYEAQNKSLAEVIEVFVRVNSGGQKLSASDLMLSVASGNIGDEDIHKKMQDAINTINTSVKSIDNGFKVDKDLILTAGLMFTNAKSLSLQKKDNYEQNQMNAIFNKNWDNIIEALKNTIQYIEYLGFNGNKLSSRNIILPIAYYFFKNNLTETHKDSTSKKASCDRIFIRQWMLRAIINDVFMEGTGSTLLRIRDLIDAESDKYFPLDALMEAKIKKELTINNEWQIDEILEEYNYGDAKIIPILMDLTQSSPDTYQIDHIWPKSLLLSKKAFKKNYPTATDEEFKKFKDKCHKLANLQLLSPKENQEKNDILYEKWIETNHNQPNDEYFTKHLIPKNISYKFKDFINFVEKRNEILRRKIKDSFPDSFSELVKRYGLEDKIK